MSSGSGFSFLTSVVLVALHVIFAVIVARYSKERKLGFVPALLISLIISPILGFILSLILGESTAQISDVNTTDASSLNVNSSLAQFDTMTQDLDLGGKMEALKKLHDEGLINAAEFKNKKLQLLTVG